MEISASDLDKIKDMVSTMLKGPDVELEATFGRAGQVDVETFLRVAKRLSALGYNVIPQNDKLNILLRDQVRLSLENMGQIQQYCRDDRAFGKTLTAIRKDRSPGVIVTHILKEYAVMVKTRRELPLSYNEDSMPDCDRALQLAFAQWDNQPKAFRMIKRWTFEKDGVRFDLSMIRSTSKDKEGHYKWVRKFHDEDIMSNAPTYEMEVELMRPHFMGIEDKKEREATAVKRLSAAIGVVLRGIQNNTLLIKESEVVAAYNEYKSLVGGDEFRGVKPITLMKENMAADSEGDDTITTLRTGYNVTDKADGLRVHGFVTKSGELFMIDMNMKFYKTGYYNKELAHTLVDGEWVTVGKEVKDPTSDVTIREVLNNLYVFDIYYFKGSDVSQKSFWSADESVKTRYKDMASWQEALQGSASKKPSGKNALVVNNKRFFFHNPAMKTSTSIFSKAGDILDTEETRIYETDGLIFTPNTSPLPSKSGAVFNEQFKWKPARENTVDFLVKFEKDDNGAEKINIGINPSTGETYRYKTLRLYVGGRADNAWDDPRATILNVLEIPKSDDRTMKPVIFTPAEYSDTNANVCNLPVERDNDTGQDYVSTTDSVEPIRDLSIVEMAYEPEKPQGWRWKPLVTRPDKTAKFLRGIVKGTMNTIFNANIIWNSIHDPVTVSMIRTGSDRPTEDEQKAMGTIASSAAAIKKTYYERKAEQEDLDKVKGLRDFHKDIVKRTVLYSVLKKKSNDEIKYVLDTSVGRAADIHNWLRNKVDFVLGVDYAGENITEPEHGAYARYMSVISRTRDKSAVIPPMLFTIGDSSLALVDGSAGQTPEETDMLRAVFGMHTPTGTLPPYFEKKGLYGKMRDGAHVVSSMFALHYFFETKEKFAGFLKNLDDTLKVGGYFIGACFDGRSLMKDAEFMKKKAGERIIGVDGDVELWSIVKGYENDEIDPSKAASFYGKAIDVNFISIGTSHREYLMPFELLTLMLKEKGIELLTADECKELGVPASTQLFGATYEWAEAQGKKYEMSDAEKRFSFFNRWFIFKRRTQPTLADTENAQKAYAARLTARQADCRMGFKISAKSAARDSWWLDYTSYFPIVDETNASVTYPSIKHYIMAKLFEGASTKPESAAEFRSDIGIHQKYLGTMTVEKAAGKLTDVRLRELMKEESDKLNEKLKPAYLKKAGIAIDAASWAAIKDERLKYALRMRYERDAEFHRIVDSLKAQNKALVYEAESKASDMGGVCRADGTIEGENKYGKFLMEIAGF